jgi:hypothetical protein
VVQEVAGTDIPAQQFTADEYAKLQAVREAMGLGHLKGKKKK